MCLQRLLPFCSAIHEVCHTVLSKEPCGKAFCNEEMLSGHDIRYLSSFIDRGTGNVAKELQNFYTRNAKSWQSTHKAAGGPNTT